MLIKYIIKSTKRNEEFDIVIDDNSNERVIYKQEDFPDWTKLGFLQCPHCPLSSNEIKYCPVAKSLTTLANQCGQVISCENVHLIVHFEHRTYVHYTTAARAMSSLMGLLFATSGCPKTNFLKPVARFHLPLATQEETIYRVASSFLLGKFFSNKAGADNRIDLSGLSENYDDLNIVNLWIAKRLRASEELAELNALTELDLFTQIIPISIEEHLADLTHVFFQ